MSADVKSTNPIFLEYPRDFRGNKVEFGSFVCPKGANYEVSVNLAESVKEICFQSGRCGYITTANGHYEFQDNIVNDAFVLTFNYMMEWLNRCSKIESAILAKGTDMTIKDFSRFEMLASSIRKANSIISNAVLHRA